MRGGLGALVCEVAAELGVLRTGAMIYSGGGECAWTYLTKLMLETSRASVYGSIGGC